MTEFDVTARPAFVYRLYGESDALLYIGITSTLQRRLDSHARTQPWWNEVTRQTIAEYRSREEAFQAEQAAILAEQPKYNAYSKTPNLNGENGYPPDWKLLQAYVPPELWRALQLQKIATGQSVAEYIRETLTAAICHMEL